MEAWERENQGRLPGGGGTALRNIRINKVGKRNGRMCTLNVQEPDQEEKKMKV